MMKFFPHLYTLCLLSFLSTTSLYGQTPLDDTTYHALNNYVKYVNQNINTLQYFHQKFKRFNVKLNHYYSTYPPSAEARIAKEQTHGALVFSDSNQTSISLSSLYEQTISTSSVLKPASQKALNQPTDVMMKVIFRLVNLNAELDQYVSNKDYLDEPKLSTAYAVLNKVRLSFHEFTLARDDLEYELSLVMKRYKFDDSPDEVWELQKQLMALLDLNKQVLNSLKKDDIPEMKERVNQLAQQFNTLPVAKKSLKQLRQTNKARWRALYDDYVVVKSTMSELIRTIQRYESSPETTEMKMLGKAYVYYNEHALNKYNALIEIYGEWLEVSGKRSLNRMEEVPWFTALTPHSLLDGAAPNNLIFLLDVSSSMNRPERLPLLQESMKRLVAQMRPIDRIAIVTYSGKSRVVLHSTSARELKKIERAIDNLKSSGESNAFSGLKMAYEVLDEHFIKNGNNRIILATDGYFNMGTHFTKLIQEQAFLEKRLSVFYFGDNEIRFKKKLQRLANAGKGNYIHIRPENVDQMLIKEAKAVKSGS
ncbi:MAG: vWA domain-containing protein [Flammeovirgaceae bacterium]